MSDTKRVVVTGMGVISSIGNNVETFWQNLIDGVCGIDYITEFPTEDLPVKIAGKIKDFNAEDYGMDKPFIRKQDLFTQYGMAAAYQAMADAGLHTEGEEKNIDPFRLGVYVGSGIGGFEVQYRETAKMIEDPSGHWISPLFIPTMISNIAAGHIAIKHNAQGPCLDIVTACATSSHCLGEAMRAIRHGYADAIIAGGCENATIPLGIAGFANAKALSRAEDPQYASLPFNGNRQGFVMGDGAGILVLEEYEHAKARGAKIYGEMVGYGNTCDAYHPTAPRPDGTTQAKCISLALEEA
ncbi:MAG: beta-ketoacyl-[Bacteroidales bacterium]|nr:beta-ketoacyl-[acyl-carrier-protein] synthase II [Bacteroidales bacterium]